jgi:hypothetical protein
MEDFNWDDFDDLEQLGFDRQAEATIEFPRNPNISKVDFKIKLLDFVTRGDVTLEGFQMEPKYFNIEKGYGVYDTPLLDNVTMNLKGSKQGINNIIYNIEESELVDYNFKIKKEIKNL